MKLTFIGAAHEVTGSCTLLEACGKHILIDCGMEQGGDTYENCELPVAPSEIDAICLTHAHIDHSGMIPAMVTKGYAGPVYCTEATHRLCNIMLQDSAHIQEQEAEWQNRKAERSGYQQYVPVYTVAEALESLKLFEGHGYNKPVEIFEGVTINFCDAGHLLGSSSIHITVNENGEERTVLFSGDLGNIDRPLIRNPQIPPYADYVVIESTYGNRIHGEERPDYVGEFTAILRETFEKGGNVVIPSFAVGRTQEMLYFIREIKEKNLIPEFPDFEVYVDSPMAIESTTVFNKNIWSCFDDEALALVNAGVNPLLFKGLKTTTTSDESKLINFNQNPKVIISASGMCEAGRIRHHLKHNLWRSDSTICFVGYQAEGTLGRKLIEGAESVKLFGEVVEVNARIVTLKGISGHADMNGLLDWLDGFKEKPAKVFVVHGEDRVTDEFAQTVTERFDIPAYAPYSGAIVDLITGEVVTEGVRIPIKRSDNAAHTKKVAVFNRVVAAAKRLLEVVFKNEGLANKELAKFESQIQSLADKWDR